MQQTMRYLVLVGGLALAVPGVAHDDTMQHKTPGPDAIRPTPAAPLATVLWGANQVTFLSGLSEEMMLTVTGPDLSGANESGAHLGIRHYMLALGLCVRS